MVVKNFYESFGKQKKKYLDYAGSVVQVVLQGIRPMYTYLPVVGDSKFAPVGVLSCSRLRAPRTPNL